MARLLEDGAKQLLSAAGILVPRFAAVTDSDQAEKFASDLGKGVVIKALLPIGGRAKLGLVKYSASPADAREVARSLLGREVSGFEVDRLLVEEKVDTGQEFYTAITNDAGRRRPVVLVSSKGGIDIQEQLSQSPEALASEVVDNAKSFEEFQARSLWIRAGVSGSLLGPLSNLTWRLWQVFKENDATLLEVNPIAVTQDRRVVAVSCVLEVDDDALFRHPELEGRLVKGLDRVWRPPNEREKLVMKADSDEPTKGDVRYAEFDDGDIGFVCGGGGGSLLLQDAVRAFGGKPANFSEWGGNPSENKVEVLTRTTISKPGVKGLLVCLNVSNNTRIDAAANALARVLKGVNPREFPVVIRLVGLNDESARSTIEEAGFEYHGEDLTMEDAAALIVKKVRALQ